MPTKEWTDKPTGNELENGMCRLEPELEAAVFKNIEGLYEGDGIQSIPRLYTEIELQAAIAAAIMARWRDPTEYAAYEDCGGDQLVQVLCEVVRIDADGWDHVSIGDHTIGDKFVSIGFISDDVDLVDGEWMPGWLVAGWNMSQDCFTDARGFRVIGWQPRAPISIPAEAMKGGA